VSIFPSIEPTRREYDLGDFPMEEEVPWPGVGVRFRTGFDPLAVEGLTLTLTFEDLRETQMQQIRTHCNSRQGGTVPFTLPAVIWLGDSDPPVPTGTRWRYLAPPEEKQKKGGWFDVTVELEARGFLATVPPPPPPPPPPPGPIPAAYSQRSVYVENDAATAEGMTNGITAETTQTGTNDHYDAAGAWLEMDFGSQTSFSAVVVGCDFDGTLVGGYGKTYTENCDIIGSNDATTWTTLGNTGTFTQALQEYATPAASYRYVRIRKANDYLAVTEFYALA
jgi:hypothetical protein